MLCSVASSLEYSSSFLGDHQLLQFSFTISQKGGFRGQRTEKILSLPGPSLQRELLGWRRSGLVLTWKVALPIKQDLLFLFAEFIRFGQRHTVDLGDTSYFYHLPCHWRIPVFDIGTINRFKHTHLRPLETAKWIGTMGKEAGVWSIMMSAWSYFTWQWHLKALVDTCSNWIDVLAGKGASKSWKVLFYITCLFRNRCHALIALDNRQQLCTFSVFFFFLLLGFLFRSCSIGILLMYQACALSHDHVFPVWADSDICHADADVVLYKFHVLPALHDWISAEEGNCSQGLLTASGRS